MAAGGEPALVADSFEGRGQVRGLEAVVFDGYNEWLRNGAQPAVDAGLRDSMQPQAGRNPGGSLRWDRCDRMCGNEFKTLMIWRMMT